LDKVSGTAAPPPSRSGGKRHPAEAARNRAAMGRSSENRLLFDVMAEERKEAQEAQGVRKKLEKCSIEGVHTSDSNKTPGFGVETPQWGASGANTASGSRMESCISSGITSPMAAGQISPWLLEAEALVNDEDDDCLFESRPMNNSAWAFEPARLLSPCPEVSQLEELNEALNDMIADGDVDELEQVGMFSAGGSPERNQPEFSLGNDSLASTATSAQVNLLQDKEKPFAKSESAEELSSIELPRGKRGPAKGLYNDFQEYAKGDKVKYYSSSRGEWLPAVVVEKKSKSVYVIDKQMKGCLAKVRGSELISAAEERDDPVLRALATAFKDRPTSRAGTPRGRDGDRPSSRSGTPRRDGGSPRNDGNGSSPRGGNWQPPGQGAPVVAAAASSLRRRKGEPLGALQKAPSIHAELPPALAALAGPASKSPQRGQIVRDDFSDDSEDD